MKIGQVLRLYRKEFARMSPDEWGDLFGKSMAYVCRVERGEARPEDKYLRDIQYHFDSEVLGAYICGINDYTIQRERVITLAKENNIPARELIASYQYA